jgi:hypothetical protein
MASEGLVSIERQVEVISVCSIEIGISNQPLVSKKLSKLGGIVQKQLAAVWKE